MNVVSLFSAVLLSGALLGASVQHASAHGRAVGELGPQPARPVKEPHDPKKKNAGDACKSSDECQPHHSCVKNGDKSVCQAPERSRLPPGAVT
ncbi:MAG: hypothetical protein JNJ46_06635 [Myxococcales bacterium]|nr:hypothetical protein [Myxococcales bacterium]